MKNSGIASLRMLGSGRRGNLVAAVGATGCRVGPWRFTRPAAAGRFARHRCGCGMSESWSGMVIIEPESIAHCDERTQQLTLCRSVAQCVRAFAGCSDRFRVALGVSAIQGRCGPHVR
jgi:hypothetical protein